MIEYLAPSGGGNALTYPIKQTTVNLSSADFTTLNANPLIIIDNRPNIAFCPLHIIIQYENINWPIGYQAYFNINGTTFQIWPITRDIYRQTGIAASSAFYISVNYPNVLTNQRFILTAATDNGVPSFSQFIVTVTYIEYTPI